MIDSLSVKGTFFDSAIRTWSARMMPLDQYINEVKNGVHAPTIARIRELVSAGKNKEAESLKKELSLYVAGGEMQGGRRLEHMVAYSGCICTDIDDPAIPPQEVLRIAGNLPYVKAGHISPSGTGNKLFILVDSPLECHSLAFELVRRRIETDIPGVTVDRSGKDPNRGCFVSHDPDAFYKEESEVLSLPMPEPAPVTHASRPEAGRTADALTNYIDKYEQDNPFAAGGRHSHVVKLAAVLNNAGFSPYEVAAECTRRYVQPDFPAGEIEKTVTDIYRRYSASHGCNPYRPKEEQETKKCLKSLKNSPMVPAQQQASEGDQEQPDIEPDNLLLPRFGKDVYENLPPILTDILERAPGEAERDAMLFAALTLISSVTSNVRGSIAEKIHYPCLFGALLGPSGSGKGCVAGMHALIAPWQQYIYDNSRCYVKEYERKKMEYDLYIQSKKRPSKNAAPQAGLPPEEPEVVKQRNLNIFGYTTLARFIELLQVNSPYASCLFETEMESLIHTMGQDFGGYGYLLNQAYHHERAGNDSKTNGTFMVAEPKLALFVTGTDGMFPQLVPSTENGTFSRLLIYKLTGDAAYRGLTSADDSPTAANCFDVAGQRILDIGIHLDGSPTWVNYTDAQRKRIDRFFEREYEKVRVFDNEDLASAVLRYRLAMFRIAMVLTALRKGEARSLERVCTVCEDDYRTAFRIMEVCLQHAYVVSTSLNREKRVAHYKFPYIQQKFFADLPDRFKRAELIEKGNVRGISKSSVNRMIKKCEEQKLIVSVGAGYFEKTTKGKTIVAPEIP